MSLQDPVKVDVASEDNKKNSTNDKAATVAKKDDETFAIPENLSQHFVVVPSKLRLITLAAFILWKCKVSEDKDSQDLCLVPRPVMCHLEIHS